MLCFLWALFRCTNGSNASHTNHVAINAKFNYFLPTYLEPKADTVQSEH